MILTPTMMMQIMPLVGQFAGAAIGGKKGKRIAKQSAALGGLLGMAGNIGKAFGSPSTGLKIGEGTEGVGPLANADEYIGGLTGSIADKTQQNFSGWSMDKGFLGDTFKSKQASLFDPYSGLLG